MRNLDRGEPLLPWLLTHLPDAQHVAVSGEVTEDGVLCIADELRTLLSRGSSVTFWGATEVASLVALHQEFPGLLELVPFRTQQGLRIAVQRDGSHVVAFVGSGAFATSGLHEEATGLILDDRRDLALARWVLSDLQRGVPESRGGHVALGDLLQPVVDGLEVRQRHRDTIPTGHSDFDLLTGGGTPGHLWVVNGPSGVGKTVFVLGLARSAAIHALQPTHWLAGREDPTFLVELILCAESRVPLHHLRSGTLTDDDWARLARGMAHLAERRMTFARLRSRLDTALDDLRTDVPRPRLLVVDALKDPTDVEALTTLRNYAMTSGTWVVAVAPDLPGHTAEHIQRAQSAVADLTLWLVRPDMTDPDSSRVGEADIRVTRSRTSPVGTVTVDFQGNYARFGDLTY